MCIGTDHRTDSETQTDSEYNLLSKCHLLKQQLEKCHEENIRLTKKFSSSQSKIKILQRRITNNRLKETHQKLQRNVRKIFSASQFKKLNCEKRVNWTSSDIAKSLAVASMSRRAYETIRDLWKIPLPATRTLKRWVHEFKCESGWLKEIFALMKEEGKTMDLWKKLTVINFDEMNIDSAVTFDKSSDEILGPYSKAQVIIAKGLCINWKQPIYYKFDQKVTKDILFETIKELESAGYVVCALVSDLGGQNQELWKALNVSYENSCFPNPESPDRSIWMFADAPHMLKLLRNHLIDQGWILVNGTVVNKSILEHLIRKDDGELKLCPRLTHELLDLKGAERMKVAPASVIFSTHTAALSRCCFPKNEEIGDFFQLIDDYFDIFNSRIPKDNQKVIRSAYGMVKEEQDKKLDEIYFNVSRMRCCFWSKKDKKLVPRKALLPCQKGILASIKSLKGLHAELKSEFNVSYIITKRLTQDALESLFSVIRSLGRTHDNPNASQFKSRMKIVLLGSKIKAPVGANVLAVDDDSYYISAKLFDYVLAQNRENIGDGNFRNEKETLPDTFYEKVNVLEKESECSAAALKYLAGYLAFVLKKKYEDFSNGIVSSKCAPEFANKDEKGMLSNWIFELSRGGLQIPDSYILNSVQQCENTFRYHFPQNRLRNVKGITDKIKKFLQEKHPEIKPTIIKEFVKIRTKIRVKFMNLKCSSSASEIKLPKKRPNTNSTKSNKNIKKSKQFLKSRKS